MKHLTTLLMISTIFSVFSIEEANAGAARTGYIVLQYIAKSGATISFAVRNDVLSGVGIGYLGNELYNRIHSNEPDKKTPGFILPEQQSQPLLKVPRSISIESTNDLSSFLSEHLTDQNSNPSITKLGDMSCLQRRFNKLLCHEKIK